MHHARGGVRPREVTADEGAGESVRVLGTPRPRRRVDLDPAEPPTSTAQVGARHIEPGEGGGPSAAWIARTLAIAALALVAVALLLLLRIA